MYIQKYCVRVLCMVQAPLIKHFSQNNVFTSLVGQISESTKQILVKFLPHVPYTYAEGANRRNVQIFILFFWRQTVKKTLFFEKCLPFFYLYICIQNCDLRLSQCHTESETIWIFCFRSSVSKISSTAQTPTFWGVTFTCCFYIH